MFVTGLLLDEPSVEAVFDLVSDVGAAEGVEVQAGVQANSISISGEAGVHLAKADPGTALGRPASSRASGGEQRADFLEPLLEDWPTTARS